MSVLTQIFGGGLGQLVKDVVGTFKLSPEKKAELEALVEQHATELRMREMEIEQNLIDRETRIIEAVNKTMQAEAGSVGWLTRSWRPICGLTLAATVVNNYILLPYFQAFGIRPIDIPEIVWQTLLAVVGVSAATRGLSQIAASWKKGTAK